MAKRLTEEMVIARTKISDLSTIKRLNCWGSELVDVSLLRRMPAVEVLSLSINKINSLEDFADCKRLEELYIRQNDIRDLNQVVHLQNLTKLKNLWLGENPCTNTEGYRYSVLRALPQLQKLDNVAVTPEELREAQRKGKVLTNPDDTQESEEEVYVPNNQYKYQDFQQETEYYSPQQSPSRQENEYENEEVVEDNLVNEETNTEDVPPEYSPPRQLSPPRRQQEQTARRSYSPEQEYVERRRSSYEQNLPKQNSHQYYDRSPVQGNQEEIQQVETQFREPRIVNSQSTSNIKEYTNGDRYAHSNPNYRQTDGSEVSYRTEGPVRSASQHNCNVAHRPPFTRRPVTRNSNILSAVLCLVKELDYPSLEVVEMAVRCRMDELDE